MRIAMWSGPRNLSTAMMYAFGARPDFAVMDEPFYAAYLAASGAAHPMGDEITASHETDPDKVIQSLTGPISGGQAHVYQKHMPHHMCQHFDLDWVDAMTHVFLIRHPARVVASYAIKAERVSDVDVGFVDQVRIFDALLSRGHRPLVVDSADIRDNPEGMLRALCAALGLSFDPAMLSWPAGGHASDGVWARHWYGAVHRSTGFAGPEGPLPDLPDPYRALADRGLPAYERFREMRLTAH